MTESSMEISRNTEVLPLWLRDVFGRIEKIPVYEYRGLLDGIDDEQVNNSIFISADDIFAYCSKQKLYTGMLVIAIPNLRDLYWNKRKLLSVEEVNKLSIEMEEPPTRFRDIGSGMYQLFGNITPYDIIHIPVSYFIECLNRKVSIEVMLNNTNTTIRLDYLQHDFWDVEEEQLIENIPEIW